MRRMLLLSFLFAACQSAAADPTPALEALAQHQAALSAELHQLTRCLAEHALAVPAAEPPQHAELCARIAALDAHLSELRPPVPVDASTAREHDAALAIGQLRDALARVERRRDVIATNLANVDTTGWKKRLATASSAAPDGVELLCTTGALSITDRALDVAIDGDGWFAAALPDGTTGYTRNGALQLDAEGRLVTGDGNALLPGAVVAEDTLEVAIDPQGRVTGRTANAPDAATTFGRIELVRFLNPGRLAPCGRDLHRATPASGAPQHGEPGQPGLGLLKQGFLEGSNVQITDELVNLQLAERELATLRRALADYGIFVR